jgi:hypothetical protein
MLSVHIIPENNLKQVIDGANYPLHKPVMPEIFRFQQAGADSGSEVESEDLNKKRVPVRAPSFSI